MTGYNFVDISLTLTVFHVLVLYEMIMCVMYLFSKQESINVINWIGGYSQMAIMRAFMYMYVLIFIYTLSLINFNFIKRTNSESFVYKSVKESIH